MQPICDKLCQEVGMPLSSAVWDALLFYHLPSSWVNATPECLLASVWLVCEEEVLLQPERKVKGHFA